MEVLSAKELKVLNNLSLVHDPTVALGTKIQEIISQIPIPGTPVNAVNSTATLTISGTVSDGETVGFVNMTTGLEQVYEFLADVAQTKTDPLNIAVDINPHTVKASGLLTIATKPTSGDTMTIGTKVYTFVPVGTDTADGEISIGVDVAAARLNIVAAINGALENTAHPLVSCSAFTGTDATITAFVGGVAGNSIPTTETFTAAGNIFGAVTLESGADCSIADASAHLVAAITANDTLGVTASDDVPGTIDLVIEPAGALGNNFGCGISLANGDVNGDGVTSNFEGGVNGTVGFLGRPVIDDTYLYVCIADNTISGKNWRRIAVGNVY